MNFAPSPRAQQDAEAARSLIAERLAGGPDEVHLGIVARAELEPSLERG